MKTVCYTLQTSWLREKWMSNTCTTPSNIAMETVSLFMLKLFTRFLLSHGVVTLYKEVYNQWLYFFALFNEALYNLRFELTLKNNSKPFDRLCMYVYILYFSIKGYSSIHFISVYVQNSFFWFFHSTISYLLKIS